MISKTNYTTLLTDNSEIGIYLMTGSLIFNALLTKIYILTVIQCLVMHSLHCEVGSMKSLMVSIFLRTDVISRPSLSMVKSSLLSISSYSFNISAARSALKFLFFLVIGSVIFDCFVSL